MKKRTEVEIKAAKERMFALKNSKAFEDFTEEMNRIKFQVMSRAASSSDGNLDTKTIGILRGIEYALDPERYVV